MANSFDIIGAGLDEAFGKINDHLDAQAEDDHNTRRIVAKGIISDRNKQNLFRSADKLKGDIASTMLGIDYGDQESVDNGREKIFGETGLINTSRDKYKSTYTKIPDTHDRFLSEVAFKTYEEQRSVSIDAFIKTEQEETSALLEAGLLADLSHTLSNTDWTKGVGDVNELHQRLEEEFANQTNAVDLFSQQTILEEAGSRDPDHLEGRTQINPRTGQAQAIISDNSLSPGFVLGQRAALISSVVHRLVSDQREGLALELLDSLVSDEELPEYLKGVAEFAIPGQHPSQPSQNLYNALRDVIRKENEGDLVNLKTDIATSSIEQARLATIVRRLSAANEVGQLSPEGRSVLDQTQNTIMSMEEGILDRIESIASVAEAMGTVGKHYKDDLLRDFKTRQWYQKVGLTEGGGGIGSGDVGAPRSSGGSLQNTFNDFSLMSQGDNDPIEVFKGAIQHETIGDDAPGLDKDGIDWAIGVIRQLNKQGKEPMASSFFQAITEAREKSGNKFYTPSFDNMSEIDAVLENARGVDDFLHKWDILNDDSNFGDRTFKDLEDFSEIVDGGKRTSKKVTDYFVGNDPTVSTDTSGRRVSAQGPRSMTQVAHALIRRDPALSTSQAVRMARNLSTESGVLGYVAGVSLEPTLVNRVVSDVLLAEDVHGFNFEEIGPFDPGKVHEALSQFELIPIAIDLDNPGDQRFAVKYRSTGNPAYSGRSGEPIIMDFNELVGNESIQSVEDLNSWNRDGSITDELHGFGQDQASALNPYNGEQPGALTNILNIFNSVLPRSGGANRSTYELWEDPLYASSEDVRFFYQLEFGKAVGDASGLYEGHANVFSGRTFGQALYEGDARLREDIADYMGEAGVQQFDNIRETARYSRDRGRPKRVEEVNAYSYKMFMVEYAIRKHIDDEGMSTLDLQDYVAGGTFVADLFADPLTAELANDALEQFELGDFGTDLSITADRLLHGIANGVDSAAQAAYEILDNKLRDARILPEGGSARPSPKSDGRRHRAESHRRPVEADPYISEFQKANAIRHRDKYHGKSEATGKEYDTSLMNEIIPNTNIVFASYEDLNPDYVINAAVNSEGTNPDILIFKGGRREYDPVVMITGIAERVAAGDSMSLDVREGPGKTRIHVGNVWDGDTIYAHNDIGYRVSVVTENNHPPDTAIRFSHTNTPEIANMFKGTDAEKGGVEARNFIIKQINGKEVWYEPLTNADGSPQKDRFNRQLGTVSTRETGDLQIALVAAGKGVFRPSPAAVAPGEMVRVQAIQEAEETAKQLGIGINRRPVKQARVANENWVNSVVLGLKSGDVQLVDREGAPSKLKLAVVTPFLNELGADDSYIIPLFDPETGTVYSKAEALHAFDRHYAEEVIAGNLYAYPDANSAKLHMDSFSGRLLKRDDREMLLRNRLNLYFDSTKQYRIDDDVSSLLESTQDWAMEDLTLVLEKARLHSPHIIPSRRYLHSLYRRYVSGVE